MNHLESNPSPAPAPSAYPKNFVATITLTNQMDRAMAEFQAAVNLQDWTGAESDQAALDDLARIHDLLRAFRRTLNGRVDGMIAAHLEARP